MARHLKIAAAQLGPLHKADSRAVAVSRLRKLLRDAHSMGAKFVVFPELALTTFFPRWWMENQAEVDARYFEKSMPSAETQPLFDEAKKFGIGFYIGYAELTPEGRRYNTAILVGPDGAIVGKYRKIHLPGHADHKPKAAFQHLEKKYFEVGDLGFRVWRYLGTITGMLICNDRRWPEAFRVLALQGAEIVALGFNTPTENLHYPEPPALRVHHHLIMAQAMAFQNATWLVETAKCGYEDGFRMFGHSLIVAPTGEIAVKSQTEEDEVICTNADIDMAANLKRTMFNFAAHLPHERYKLLIGLVIPRPIAWISTRSANGVANCPPFSFFNVFSEDPPLCVIGINPRSDGAMKHSLKNIRRTREFVVNLVDEATANAMHISSYEFAEDVSEFEKTGLSTAPALTVQHPR